MVDDDSINICVTSTFQSIVPKNHWLTLSSAGRRSSVALYRPVSRYLFFSRFNSPMVVGLIHNFTPGFTTTSGGGTLAESFRPPMTALCLTHRKERRNKDLQQAVWKELQRKRCFRFTPTDFCPEFSSTPSGNLELRILPITFQIWFPNIFSGLFARSICEINATNFGNSSETSTRNRRQCVRLPVAGEDSRPVVTAKQKAGG